MYDNQMSLTLIIVLVLIYVEVATSDFITANSGGGIRACIGNAAAIYNLEHNYPTDRFVLSSISGSTWNAEICSRQSATYSWNYNFAGMNRGNYGPPGLTPTSPITPDTSWTNQVDDLFRTFYTLNNTGKYIVFDHAVLVNRNLINITDDINWQELYNTFIYNETNANYTILFNDSYSYSPGNSIIMAQNGLEYRYINWDTQTSLGVQSISRTLSVASSAWTYAILNGYNPPWWNFPYLFGLPMMDAGLKYNIPIRETCELYPGSKFLAFDYSWFSSTMTGFEIISNPVGYIITSNANISSGGCYAIQLQILTTRGSRCNVLFVPFLGSNGLVLSQFLPTIRGYVFARQAQPGDSQYYLNYGDMIYRCIKKDVFEPYRTSIGQSTLDNSIANNITANNLILLTILISYMLIL